MSVLVHIGYHKTGSNWLQHMLFEDPATGYAWLGHETRDHPVRRVIHDRPLEFDAEDVRSELLALAHDAESRGLHPVVSLERLSGHPFSGGHDSRQIADRLHAVAPDGRVLIVIREQRSMILATYKQYVKAGGTGTVSQFLEPATTRSLRASLFDFRHFEYDHLIGYYRSLFGADGVLVLPFEQLARDGRAFVERIADFAGRPIPSDVLERLPYTTRSNPSPSALTIAGLRRVNRFTPRTELDPAPVAEWRRAEKLAQRLKKTDLLNRRPTRRLAERAEESLRRTIWESVGERYTESNRQTAGLTGLDLAAYGWPV
jgi:sulfotransferase family protein